MYGRIISTKKGPEIVYKCTCPVCLTKYEVVADKSTQEEGIIFSTETVMESGNTVQSIVWMHAMCSNCGVSFKTRYSVDTTASMVRRKEKVNDNE